MNYFHFSVLICEKKITMTPNSYVYCEDKEMCAYIYMYTRVCTYMYTYIYTRIYIHTHIYTYIHIYVCVCVLCPTFCDPVDHNPSGSSVHGILQAKILEWIAIPFSRGSS